MSNLELVIFSFQLYTFTIGGWFLDQLAVLAVEALLKGLKVSEVKS